MSIEVISASASEPFSSDPSPTEQMSAVAPSPTVLEGPSIPTTTDTEVAAAIPTDLEGASIPTTTDAEVLPLSVPDPEASRVENGEQSIPTVVGTGDLGGVGSDDPDSDGDEQIDNDEPIIITHTIVLTRTMTRTVIRRPGCT